MLAIAYAYDRDTGPDAGGREPDAAEGSIRSSGNRERGPESKPRVIGWVTNHFINLHFRK